jgi:hypothetical protein
MVEKMPRNPRFAAPLRNDSKQLMAAQPQLACRSYRGVLGLTVRRVGLLSCRWPRVERL